MSVRTRRTAACLVTLLTLCGCALLVSSNNDWTAQCSTCKCMWANGKKTADCKNLTLSDIPVNLSAELREIDFSYNALYELRARVFERANLRDVHKLKLQNCSIQTVHPTAFGNLLLLIELDLSENAIQRIDRFLFQDNIKLRMLDLRNNRIKRLDSGLFSNQTQLQRVDVSYNELEEITADIFKVTPRLRHLSLAYNKIKHMNYDFTANFSVLNSISLDGNLWVCDCHLQEFRNASMQKNLITSATCNEPEQLKHKSWKDVSVIFACPPVILSPAESKRFDVTTANFTMSCSVKGDPKPDIDWIFNGRILERDPRLNTQKYVTQEDERDSVYMYNLTIINVTYRDKGEYKCLAKNPAGVQERNFTLAVSGLETSGGGFNSGQYGKDLPLIIGLIFGALLLLVLVMVLIFCCCRRTGRDNHIGKNRSLNQSSEMYGMEGTEMEKALITNVNPLVKPPRQYSMPPSETSRGTEVSETKKMLDSDSIFAGEDDNRSFDYESRVPPPKPPSVEEYRTDHHPYPPDLLSFPPRGLSQISPAGSSSSTVADTSRLPPHHGPQSPLHSPLYEAAAMYRTLPYSRSQSPFTSPLGQPVRAARQGYVTIPRRPRQSWSSEPPPTTEVVEPLYDNLGLRTTASGNSVLSLNKIGASGNGGESTTSAATTPRTPRGGGGALFALTPTIPDAIAEHDSPPVVATLPRSASANCQKANLRNWARSPEPVDSRRESTASLIPASPADGKSGKVPPRPPPKPKKRVPTGPLFEDEGEDGTEV